MLRSHPGSHLVNLSSIYGIVAPPGQTAYCASKFAVRGFTEALRSELAPDNMGVTCVHPGGIATRIATTARAGSGVPESDAAHGRERANRMLTIPPGTAATAIPRGVEFRRPRVLIADRLDRQGAGHGCPGRTDRERQVARQDLRPEPLT